MLDHVSDGDLLFVQHSRQDGIDDVMLSKRIMWPLRSRHH